MKITLKLFALLTFAVLLSCSPRYTKQFVADELEEEDFFYEDDSGWIVNFPVLSAFTNVKDVAEVTDTNKFWLTLNCFIPVEDTTTTKRDFELDTIFLAFQIIDSSKYENFLKSNDRKILERAFNMAYEKKRDYKMTIGECFAKYPFVENEIVTEIDSLHTSSDTVWTVPSRKAMFFDTDKNNFNIVYNFYKDKFLIIPENVKRVTLYFDYKIKDTYGTVVKEDRLHCAMGKQISTEARLFFLE